MKTIKGPAIFLAQFAGDEAPFDSLDGIAAWASRLGFKGVQIPSWDKRLFDLDQAAESQAYCDDVKGTCRASWWPCTRPMTTCSTALPRPKCTANRTQGRSGPWAS